MILSRNTSTICWSLKRPMINRTSVVKLSSVKHFGGNSGDDKTVVNNKDKLSKLFQSLCSWRSQSQVTDQLEQSAVYHEPSSGLLVINKPHGLPIRATDDCPYDLTNSLPSLATRFGLEDELQVIRSTERFTSGITVLGNTNTVKNYKKCLANQQSNRKLTSAYLCLVKGHSNLDINETVDVREVECKQVNKPVVGTVHKEPVISRNLISQHQAFRQGIRRVHLHCSTVSKSGVSEVSLVCVDPSSTSNHMITVYMSDLGHPVLGDQMYDYRCRSLFGYKVKVDTARTAANRSQVMSQSLLQGLQLGKGDEWKVPKMIHLHRLHLPGWSGKNTDLTVFAPPPSHFLKTCDLLGLKLDYQQYVEHDKVVQWKTKGEKKDKVVKIAKQTDLQENIEKLNKKDFQKPSVLKIKPKIHKIPRKTFGRDATG